MSLADAVWVRGENPANPMMVSAVLWFDRPLDVPALRRRFVERVLDRHPVFRERIVPSPNPLRMPRWVQDRSFDLDHHVEVVDLPTPGDHETLQRWCSTQRSTPLDRARPPWAVHVFRGYLGDRSAMHVRVHHGIGDGLALMRLLTGLADEADDGTVPLTDPPAMQLRSELAHLAGSSLAEAAHAARHPSVAVRDAGHVLDLVRWGARLLTPPLPRSSILLGRPNGHKEMVWDPGGLPLSDLKDAAHAADGTVNDLLLALLTGALARYLHEHGTSAEEVAVMVPVNLRPPGEPLPRHLGNQIGLLPVRLPTGLPTVAERLAGIRASILTYRHSPAPVVSRTILAGTTLLTPVGERAIHRLHQVRSAGVVTNVPGPAEPIHVVGARVEGVVGWGGMTGHLNLGVSFVSLAGRVHVGVVSDRGITHDPDRIVAHLRDEWGELPDLAAQAAATSSGITAR